MAQWRPSTLSLAALSLLFAVSGCAAVSGRTSAVAQTERVEVRMDWWSRRRLRVLSYRCRRDARGRMVVSLELRNAGEEPYDAEIRVRFLDAAGRSEQVAERPDVHEFPVRRSETIQWTSYSAEAARCVVTFRSARFLQL